MKLCKTDLIFISLEILLLTTSVFSASEIEAAERYGCDELRLNCSDRPGYVATGFIFGGHTTTASPPKKRKDGACPAPDAKSDCQAPTINGRLRDLIQRCLWRSSVCLFPVNGQQQLAYPCFARIANYLVAKQFKCVNQSNVVDVCSKSGKAPSSAITITDSSEIYLLSKNFPQIVASRLDCAVSVQSKPGFRLRFSSVFMDLHPRTRRLRSSEEGVAAAPACAFDYVSIGEEGPRRGGGADGVFCGGDVVDFVSNASSTDVRFVSGPDEKHYGGFVIRVTAEDGYGDNEIPYPNESSTTVTSTAVRSTHPVHGTRLVTFVAYATWLRLLCCGIGFTSPVDR